MEIRPILSAMMRNRSGMVLVGLQIAITLAVAVNAAFIIQQRMEKIGRPSGVDAANLFYVASYGYSPGYDSKAALVNDMAVIRRMPGVVAASSINSLPMSGGGSSNTYQPSADPKAAKIPGNYFEISEDGLKSLGVKLVAGRNFKSDEMTYNGLDNFFPKQLMMSSTMARAVFGDDRAVGKLVYDGTGAVAEVIGVAAGAALSFVFSYWLSNAFELPPLKLSFVLWGIMVLLVLGQIAVFIPARRAAAIPPAVATRTV